MKHIHYKNDFEFLLKIMGKDGAVRTVPQYRWSVVFSVGGVRYECSLRDGNAVVKGDTIVCRLQDHCFGCGELKAEFREWIPNKDWLDGVVDVSTPIDTDIELWDGKSDDAEEIVSGSVVSAYLVYDAYLTAKENGYTGMADEYYNAITGVVGIAEAEAGRVSSEELREANEQQRVREFDAMKEIVDELEGKVDGVVEDEKSFEDAIRDQVNNYKPIVIEGNVTNAADEEDITSENGLLKLKDRSALNGMGYVIIRKNKSFVEQVIKANTIYEIRYDFDLNGATIEIKEGCILYFTGGSLKNGTIKGNSTNIISDYLIFKNLNVIGSWGTIGESKWFVQSSPYTIKQDKVYIDKLDVSDDFQIFLNSSFRKIHICKGFYYITKPLIINSSIEINMDGGSSCNYLLQHDMDCIDKTFIFSDKNITLLKITANDATVKNIILNGGNLDVSLAYSNKPLYDTHCIEIDIRNLRKYWGIYINTTINGTYNDLEPSQGTAIKFIDDGYGGYATMVNLNCIIRWFDLAYDIKSGNSSWITNVNLYGECNHCNRVLDTTADTVSKVDVQTQAVFTNENVKDYPLFKSSSTLVIGGHLWDIALKQGDKTTNRYVVEITGTESNVLYNRTIFFIDSMKYYEDSFIKNNRIIGNLYIPSPLNYGDKYNFYPNLLFNVFEGYNFIKDNTYTYRLLNNVTASVDVENKNGMFLNERGTTFKIQNTDKEKVDLEITFDLTNENIYVGYVTLIYMGDLNYRKFDSCNIKINTQNYGTKELTYYDSIDRYARAKNITSSSEIFDAATSIVITFKNVSSELIIRKIIVNKILNQYFNYMPSFLPISGGTVYGKADFRNLYLKDYKITANSKGIIINDTYDAMGNPINVFKYGTTAQRPTGVKEGYQYYDTTLKKYIVWNGTEWTNMDGTNLT